VNLNHRGTEVTERDRRWQRFFTVSLCSLCLCGSIPISQAAQDISVVATVDQKTISFGDSLVFTIDVKGAQGGIQPSVPKVDGLRFDGPSHRSSTMIVNNQVSHSVQLQYAVTPARMGEFTIPAVEVEVGGKKFTTEPITITVVKSAMEEELKGALYGKILPSSTHPYVGQVVPLNVQLFVREGVPLKGIGGFQCEGEGLRYKYLKELKTTAQVVDGLKFAVHTIQGAICPTQSGKLGFGPCAVQTQLQYQRRARGGGAFEEDPLFAQFFGRVETREVAVAIDPATIEVLPLPEDGRPADFAGAVGQWTIDVTAKPTEVAVGDPITLSIKISGTGNIDTVPPIKLGELNEFKAYDPSAKTTSNDLGTQGQRVTEQALAAKDVSVKQLPEIRLSYFDPIARQYKVARQEPIALVVKPGASGQTAIVGALPAAKPREKLGQDIVYLKGDLGPMAAVTPFCATPTFWALNIAPVALLLGSVLWKRRSDKLRADVAYARRSRAAKSARKLLAEAASFDQVQHALQSYLGDRLNIPPSGITASIVEEQLVPRGLNGELAAQVKACFEECDSARFAGGGGTTADVAAIRQKVEHLIDALEKNQL